MAKEKASTTSCRSMRCGHATAVEQAAQRLKQGATWTPTDLQRDMGTENPFKVGDTLWRKIFQHSLSCGVKHSPP